MFLFYLQINKIIEIEVFSCDFRCHQRRGQKVTEERWMWNLHKKLNGAGSGARWGAARRGRCLCQPVPAGSEEICPPVVRQLQAAWCSHLTITIMSSLCPPLIIKNYSDSEYFLNQQTIRQLLIKQIFQNSRNISTV